MQNNKHINYLIFAMCRSGHHAIINWMAEQFPGTIISENNVILGWEEKEFKPFKPHKKIITQNTGPYTGWIGNLEDGYLNHFNNFNFDTFKIFEEETKVVIINRDPLNWIASCLKKGGTVVDHLLKPYPVKRALPFPQPDRITCYKQLVKQSLGEQIIDYPIIDINYNKWVQCIEYRKDIADKLDLNFTDRGLNYVSEFGCGSSFDNNYYQYNAQAMKVNERYKYYLKNQKFISYFKNDPELVDLSKNYFEMEII